MHVEQKTPQTDSGALSHRGKQKRLEVSLHPDSCRRYVASDATTSSVENKHSVLTSQPT